MIQAIVYTSQTGHTKQYAEILGQTTGLPVYEWHEAEKILLKESEIIYCGWLMAGTVKGYKKAFKHHRVRALCGVGMAGADTQLADIKKVNHLPDGLPFFYLQGGFEMDKLHGIYKLMMKTMKATVGKNLSGKENKTEEEEAMLELLLHGGNRVSSENTAEIIRWYKQESEESNHA